MNCDTYIYGNARKKQIRLTFQKYLEKGTLNICIYFSLIFMNVIEMSKANGL